VVCCVSREAEYSSILTTCFRFSVVLAREKNNVYLERMPRISQIFISEYKVSSEKKSPLQIESYRELLRSDIRQS
ncbi:hypothetical protein NPIL_639971, partial [Nephila pilipes]